MKWNEEWVVPQRLLKKRLLLSPNQENSAPPGTLSCHYEWLVKWRGLDYESVTWELESFLSSVNGASLIKEYESRHKKALDDPSSLDKVIFYNTNSLPRKLKFLRIFFYVYKPLAPPWHSNIMKLVLRN